jgi:flagellum-specific peptidoglycan hydrolase FlgJ
MSILRAALLAIALGLAATRPAAAQSTPRAAEPGKAAPKKSDDAAVRPGRGEPGKGGTSGDSGKVIRLDEMEVQGKLQKPAVLSITPPAAAVAADSGDEESFIPKILEAAERAPF